ncbi:hypothetical protein [Vibrio furnissii]|uniref:hypothetical protein n=1 Tax=Vibrio furnissii TaxID=29494 RepID=UPI001EE9E345|nr:hypothetical protein [Vibrio furnissii]MCG6268016.1 hypothetical protein [Vibrio furnissii]
MKFSKIIHINPKVSLFKNISFWFLSLTPILLGLYLGIYVWKDYSLVLSSDGYEKFIEISKLPFTVMSLSFPIIAIYMYEFKSRQNSNSLYNDAVEKINKEFSESHRILSDIDFLITRIRMHLSSFKSASSRDFSNKIRASQFNAINDLWIKCLTNSDYVDFFSSNYKSTYHVDSTFLGLSYIFNDKTEEEKDFTKTISLLDSTIMHLDLLNFKTQLDKANNMISHFNNIEDTSVMLGLKPDNHSDEMIRAEKYKSDAEQMIEELECKLLKK